MAAGSDRSILQRIVRVPIARRLPADLEAEVPRLVEAGYVRRARAGHVMLTITGEHVMLGVTSFREV